MRRHRGAEANIVGGGPAILEVVLARGHREPLHSSSAFGPVGFPSQQNQNCREELCHCHELHGRAGLTFFKVEEISDGFKISTI